MRIGVSFNLADMPASLTNYQGMKITRHFGVDYDKDGLPELPNVTSDMRWRSIAPDALIHVSYKDNVEQLNTWLNTLNREVLITWYHEPHGDVDPATYRRNAERMVAIINRHPRRHLVLGNGPIVTRFWLDEGNNPDQFRYKGLTFFGLDPYNGKNMTRYRSSDEMYGRGFDTATRWDVPVVIGEIGAELIPGDTGAGRAMAIRQWAVDARDSGMVTDWVYWNNNLNKLTDPEGDHTLRTLIYTQVE